MNKIPTMVEWEVTMLCNYSCTYCTNLDPSIKPVLDKTRLEEFIIMLGETYPGVEIFVFGGEPFLHQHIEYIIRTFNKHKIPFVIQTNLSNKSQRVLSKITEPVTLQVSIHPTQIALDDINIPTNLDIRIVDVMYTNRGAIEYYMKVKEHVKNTYLTPVADFGDGVSGESLKDYNRLKRSPAWQKVINFEEVERLGTDRSKLWEGHSPRGKPCLYTGVYFLYAPDLSLYNCCHRKNHTGICNHDKCFLM